MSTTMNPRRVRHYDESDAMREAQTEHPMFSHGSMMWTAIGTSAVGAGLSLYGANKQSKDQKGSDAANRAAIAEQDLNSWRAYLMQRGLNPAGVTQFGQIPQNAQPVNSRLPLWANMNMATGPSRWQRVRPNYQAPGTLNTGGPAPAPAAPPPDYGQ